MRRLSPHANIVNLREVIFDKKSGTLALIIELLDMNLYELIKGRRNFLTEGKCRQYIYQTMKALDHMHRNGIFHRDIKPENILMKNDVVKLADFGSCRSVYSKQPFTEYISTRWYRAPECLLTDGWYTYKMDIWSVGCVFAEILSLRPLFPGANEVDQVHKIHHIVGSPSKDLLNKFKKSKHMDFNFPEKSGVGIPNVLPHGSKDCMSMIQLMCTYDPDERPSARQILRHQYFKSLRDDDKRARAVEKAAQQASNNDNADDNASVKMRKPRDRTDRRNSEKQESILPSAINNQNGFAIVTTATPLNKKQNSFKGTTILPKIPVATNVVNKQPLPTTVFPSILNHEKDKIKAQQQAAKRLGYAQYTLPSLGRLRHGP